uniref:SJCHGC06394 protein n=1 Tax=Schistosoma japonicum TaxID=6182 RepID=Q5BS43_SCHJA|nr:SJCHGC06394 protein [Schistosoma japonicum]
MNLSQLENQISQELNSLLNELEAYNQHRRLLLKSASSGSSQTRPRTNINSASDASNDGVAV